MSEGQGRLDQLLHPDGEPRVVGVYAGHADCLAAIARLRQAGYLKLVVHSPLPSHELEAALGKGPGWIRWFALIGGILGGGGGFLLAGWTSRLGNLNTGGKPIISVPPFLIITFECAILLAGLATLLGFLLASRLPQLRMGKSYRERFSDDRFGVGVVCGGAEAAGAEAALRAAGAEEVFHVPA